MTIAEITVTHQAFVATVFADSVGFGLLADIYLVYWVSPINVWPLEDVLYKRLADTWCLRAACRSLLQRHKEHSQNTHQAKHNSLHMHPSVRNTLTAAYRKCKAWWLKSVNLGNVTFTTWREKIQKELVLLIIYITDIIVQ